MQPVYKHPNTTVLATADFTNRLASGETLSSVSTSPVTISGGSGMTYGSATINSGTVSPPGGAATIAANCGIQFNLVGGTDGTTYVTKIAGTTSAGNIFAIYLTTVVGTQY
jgi:hypothetical protein